MTGVYECVVFMQGDDAEEVLRILDEDGEEAAADYLAEWHFCGEHDVQKEPATGDSDSIFHTEDGFILTYNTRLGYAGLEHVHAGEGSVV